ncbi:MAG: DUF4097 domain-containing protein [Mollicutes bacterium]|nr:DUF4097 domain-containing protein [Mollicutes bacterium]
MKNKKQIIILIVILSILIVFLTATMFLLINKDFNFRFMFNNSQMKLIESYETLALDIENINLDMIDGDIDVRESKNENIKIEYYNNKDKNNKIISFNAGTIYVAEEQNHCFGFCFNNSKLIIYIPSTYLGLYDVKTISGDINLKVDITNKINIKTTSGDVNIEKADNIDIETTSGDIKVNKSDKAIIKSVSGDVIFNNILGSFNIKTTSGDITLGEIEINEDSFIDTVSGDVFIESNNNNNYIDYETVSGEKEINNSNRTSQFTIKIKTISGDISVN